MSTIKVPKKTAVIKKSNKIVQLLKGRKGKKGKDQKKIKCEDPLAEKKYWLTSVVIGGRKFELNVEESEKVALLEGKDLSGSLINAALTVLAMQFGNVGGWQDTALECITETDTTETESKMEPMTDQSIQIHHNGDDHWIVSTNIGGKIRVFDSLYAALTKHLQVKLVELYASFANEVGEIAILMPASQLQAEGVSGLFAVAFAVELAHGNNPWLASFDVSKMREHFCYCLEHGFKPGPDYR
jgi:hypothetical protein